MDNPPLSKEPEAGQHVTEEQDTTTLETGGQRPGKGNTGKLIAVVIVLTALAILLVPGHKAPQKATSGETTAQRPSLLAEDSADKAPATTPAPSSANRSSEVAAQDEPSLGPGGAARRLIQELRSHTPLDLDRAYAAARDFQQKHQLDDAYLMYFFAAREGHGPAAMELGRQADPTSFADNSLFDAPDELQANKWYSLALQAGVKEASDALEKLRSTVEQQAQRGDERARRIMLQWK